MPTHIDEPLPTPNRHIKDVIESIGRKGKTDYVAPVWTPQWMPEHYKQEFAELVSEHWQARLMPFHPGAGKTRDATTFVQQLWEQEGKRALYLMLSHTAIDEVLGKLADKKVSWAHWRGHEKGCPEKVREALGYSAKSKCGCGHTKDFAAEGPVIAPIDYVLEDNIQSWGVTPEVFTFDLWVIDEVDLGRLTGHREVTLAQLNTVAKAQKDTAFGALCQSLARVLASVEDAPLYEHSLYAALDVALQATGNNLSACAYSLLLETNGHGQSLPVKQMGSIPNFPPYLVPLFLRECHLYEQGQHFAPLVHLVNAEEGPQLRLRWPKRLATQNIAPEGEPGATFWHPPVLVLDATADASLLDDFLESPIVYPHEAPPWPTQAHVRQYADATIGRGTLDLYPKGKALSDIGANTRQRWYGRIAKDIKELPGFDPNWPVGFITFKGIDGKLDMPEEGRKALEAAGLNNVVRPPEDEPIYYANLRGSNKFEQVKVLVLLGCPIPNPHGLFEEASAFMLSAGLLGPTYDRKVSATLTMTSGDNAPVIVQWYEDERLQRYFEQKCQAELYQAVHRVRPYLLKPGDERFILIYTNMPIPGVEVESLLREPSQAHIDSREGRALSRLREAPLTRREYRVGDLAKEISSPSDN